LDTAFTATVNEQGLARDSTLAFTKGVVDVDLALYVEGHHPGQSAFGGPRVVILFFSYRGRTRFVHGQGNRFLQELTTPRRNAQSNKDASDHSRSRSTWPSSNTSFSLFMRDPQTTVLSRSY
jgi:hypothetical protein